MQLYALHFLQRQCLKTARDRKQLAIKPSLQLTIKEIVRQKCHGNEQHSQSGRHHNEQISADRDHFSQ